MPTTMEVLLDYLIIFGSLVGISFACAYNFKEGTFSMSIFLCTCAICIPILIWLSLLPIIMIAISALCIVGLVFGGSDAE